MTAGVEEEGPTEDHARDEAVEDDRACEVCAESIRVAVSAECERGVYVSLLTSEAAG